MLREMHIENFALIDELCIDFDNGFCVLTGETGAGKSIIVDALEAVLGGKTRSDVVRTGTDKCRIQAVFDLSNSPEASRISSEYGYEPDEDNLLIISREITNQGKSSYRINGRSCTAAVVRDITSYLVDIHGQHEHQSLMSSSFHMDIYDHWCGGYVLSLREKCESIYRQLAKLLAERESLLTDERERTRLQDLYTFQIDEIISANIQPNEDEELLIEKNRLASAEKLQELTNEIYLLLGTENNGASEKLGDALGLSIRLCDMDSSLADVSENINAALASTEEVLIILRRYIDNIEFNPAKLELVEERLDLIRTLKKKYGDTIDDILAYAENTKEKLKALETSEERSSELDTIIANTENELKEICNLLSSERKKKAKEFESLIQKELADLAMDKTKFVVSITESEIGPTGSDMIEFLISPNPGEPVKPLIKIASGGEISRVMLSLKSVVSANRVPTLVFDEVDAGIGGVTAQELGIKLSNLADSCQVLCVTHLAQLACRAKWHYAVDKLVDDKNRSVIRLRKLETDQRVTELARMLGSENSVSASEHAREMLELADKGSSKTR
ncbi:MAG: DNA repair protein RecN [Armatimonadota bacterium]